MYNLIGRTRLRWRVWLRVLDAYQKLASRFSIMLPRCFGWVRGCKRASANERRWRRTQLECGVKALAAERRSHSFVLETVIIISIIITYWSEWRASLLAHAVIKWCEPVRRPHGYNEQLYMKSSLVSFGWNVRITICHVVNAMRLICLNCALCSRFDLGTDVRHSTEDFRKHNNLTCENARTCLCSVVLC